MSTQLDTHAFAARSTGSRAARSRLVLAAACITAAGLVLTGLTGCGGADAVGASQSDADAKASQPESSGGTEQKKEAKPGLGEAVKSGDLEFTISKVEDAGTEVGSEYISTKAQGHFVALTLTVKNISKKPQLFTTSNVSLSDADGNSYDADSTATIYAQKDNDTWVSNINPGNSVSGSMLFDVPAGSTPVAATVKSGFIGDGEQIMLK